MKTSSSLVWLFAALLIHAMPVHAGPFGLSKGMTLSELKSAVNLEQADRENVYKTARVPVPHPSFESYLLLVSPQLGLCKIIALGKTLTTSVYGDAIKTEFSSLESVIAEKYGRNLKYDRLRSGSIWNEAKDWMMALLKKERTLVAFWGASEGSNMIDDIAGISLEANAMRTERGYISLSYEFSNMSACQVERKAVQKKAL